MSMPLRGEPTVGLPWRSPPHRARTLCRLNDFRHRSGVGGNPISFHEQVNGWAKYISRAKGPGDLVRGYTKSEGVLENFAHAQVLPFSAAAADVYDELRQDWTATMPD